MKPSVSEVIVVEGKYDKNTLSQVVDAVIIDISGFGLFNDAEKLALLRRLAVTRGIIVMTDSDGAGFLIRNYIKGAINSGRVLHAYIPDIRGKERRKKKPSGEGKLGVEGMKPSVIIEALMRSGATMGEAKEPRREITKADLYELGLSGADGCAERRKELMEKLSLPEHLSTAALVDVLNALFSREEFFGLY